MCATLFVGWFLVSMLHFDAFATYVIPSSSMVPTLMVGDYLVAVRGAFHDRLPLRGEIAVFVGPDGTDFVKRVIGLPGDTIQVRSGILRVNDRPVRRKRIADFRPTAGQESLEEATTRYRETLPGGMVHTILEQSDNGYLDDTPVYTVPAGHVFVLGDNRDNSMDSRTSTVGFVALDHLEDRPLCIYWSRDRSRIGQVVN